jgi:hypothetical protein
MPTEAEIRKALGVVLGRDLTPETADQVVVREYVSVWTQETEASVTSREIGTSGHSTNACRKQPALDVGGTSRTGADGKVTLDLSDYICEFSRDQHFEFSRPINFVATPRSKTPAFLTSMQTLTGGVADVAITVFSWDANGNPGKNVSFDWRCFVPATSAWEVE